MAEAEQDQITAAYEICKLQASADGAFDEKWLRHIFDTAWELCADLVGLIPPQEIEETIIIRADGSFRLSHEPTSEVRLYSGYNLVAVIPPSLERSRCDPALCCYCNLKARYMIGEETCEISPSFIQAVARVFAYIIENRGDGEARPPVDLDGRILAVSGALAFLDVTYVA